ncbi:DUF1206 domain-containing protein [Terrihabitans rhizophilus]|uniref:DUF1206 domain-containing protein n=1 Tax=Terrihabitans rhizophilus TaxID=3092662 RepID=A0ABU4RL82_9HYPH|nr:DUF1206 domain-containing protein [Terrihabitans sp. PJ23]MDX6805577.1 DUF1206 domain-containing protein [Terrihabitans sp. PJ23]
MKMTGKAVEHMARFGFAARGAVYVVIGALALLAAFGSGGQTTGSKGALQEVLTQPFGTFVLGLVVLGLFAFALWRFIEATLDADDRGSDAKGLLVRGVHILSGVVNTGLALSAAGLLIGTASSSGEDGGTQDWTAWLMEQPFGQWLVGAVGLGIVIAGGVMFWNAARCNFLKRLRCPAAHEGWIKIVGRVGYAARGVTFLLIGGFLVMAAISFDSSEAHGLGGVLRELQQQPYGWALLGLVAAGLFAFGAFGFVQARYRKIDAPDAGDVPGLARV